MHHIAVKSNILDSNADRHLRFGIDNVPVCPKPRRLGPQLPEFLKHSSDNKHGTDNFDGRSGILNMINVKITYEHESSGVTCYTGFPPGRTENPLVHDVHFVHQMTHYLPFAEDQSCRRNCRRG